MPSPKPKRVEEMERMAQRPDYQGYEKQIPGFEKAMQGGNVQECLKCVRDFLMQQTTEPEVQQYLLEKLDEIEMGLGNTPQPVQQNVGMERGVYGA